MNKLNQDVVKMTSLEEMLNVRVYVYSCEYWSIQKKINIWSDYIHTCDGKYFI